MTEEELGLGARLKCAEGQAANWLFAWSYEGKYRFMQARRDGKFYFVITGFMWSRNLNPDLKGATGPFETLEEAVSTFKLMGG